MEGMLGAEVAQEVPRQKGSCWVYIYILVTFHCDVVFTYACTNVRSNLYRYIH